MFKLCIQVEFSVECYQHTGGVKTSLSTKHLNNTTRSVSSYITLHYLLCIVHIVDLNYARIFLTMTAKFVGIASKHCKNILPSQSSKAFVLPDPIRKPEIKCTGVSI